ncbi:MAG: polysaccharide biosynthesis/export family protein [Nitrospirae bacterium]|nr:polysaccharide biosynthesis/export family protein [Nitrospirota bacterium]
MKKIFLLFLLFFAISCPSFAQDYIIGSQDLLKITVYEHPDLTTETRVSEDGKISFPLVGEIDIKNLTARQVEKKIAEKLSGGYITNPQVAVLIQQYMGQRVTIIGEVSKPGQYEITGPTYVLDIISKALGTTQNAGYIITLFRKGSGDNPKLEKLQIDLDRLLRKGELEENIQMKDKDIIFVPKGFFYVYGEVNRPGAYRIEKGLTVKRAVALAGGFNQKAAKKKVEITRRTNDKDVVRDGTLDDTIEIDDVIMVKESLF